MQNEQLTADSNFDVKESVLLDLFIAAVFYCMVITACVYNSNSGAFDKAFLFGLIPAIIYTVKAFVNNAALTINKNGVYLHKTFVTDWQHYKNAYVTQLPLKAGGYSDRFVLTIEYYKDSQDGFFERNLALTDTQNKSDEEIIAAIRFFHTLPKNV
jgi:hypothetical protein